MENMNGKKWKNLALTNEAIKILSHAAIDAGMSPKLYMQQILEEHANHLTHSPPDKPTKKN